jgi:hypothetical protein
MKRTRIYNIVVAVLSLTMFVLAVGAPHIGGGG